MEMQLQTAMTFGKLLSGAGRIPGTDSANPGNASLYGNKRRRIKQPVDTNHIPLLEYDPDAIHNYAGACGQR